MHGKGLVRDHQEQMGAVWPGLLAKAAVSQIHLHAHICVTRFTMAAEAESVRCVKYQN